MRLCALPRAIRERPTSLGVTAWSSILGLSSSTSFYCRPDFIPLLSPYARIVYRIAHTLTGNNPPPLLELRLLVSERVQSNIIWSPLTHTGGVSKCVRCGVNSPVYSSRAIVALVTTTTTFADSSRRHPRSRFRPISSRFPSRYVAQTTRPIHVHD